MIHFRKLQLINWDYWDNILLPLDDPIVNIVGPNGSGKTTLLDALRHLLRARLSSRRTLRKYLRRSDRVSLIRAVVSNAPGSSTRRRPFAPQIHDDEVTLACLMRRNGGEWESFYYILPRDVGHQEIMALDPRQALSPMTYSRHLERAGVSRSVLRVLALEQGATDQLCEKSPRELLELVFDVFGDREVIEQYQTAREEQRRAEAERDEQRRKVAGMELSVQALAGRVNQYREFHRLVETRERYRQLLPRLEYLQAQSELAGAMEALEARRAQGDQVRAERDRARQALEEQEAELARLEEARALSRQAAEEALAALQAARDERTRCQTLLAELARLEREAREAPGDAEDLTRREETLRREQARLSLEQGQVRSRLQALEAERRELSGGSGPALPREAQEVSLRLREAGVAHRFVHECLEIRDPYWQVAVESLLGNIRHAVLVEPGEDAWKAWRVGQAMRYRNFITPYQAPSARRPARPGSLLEVVEITEPRLPIWIREMLDNVRRVERLEEGRRLPEGTSFITPDGYYRERRGGRSVYTDRLYCGREAASRRQRELEAQVASARAELEQVEGELARVGRELAGVRRQLEGMGRRLDWERRRGEVEALTAGLARAEQACAEAEEAWKAVRRQDQEVLDHLGEKRARLEQARDRLRQCEREAARLGQAAAEAAEQVAQGQKRLAALARAFEGPPPEPALLEALAPEERTPESLRFELHRLEEALEQFEGERDPAVLALYERLQQEHQREAETLAEREEEARRTTEVADRAREAYLEVLRNSVRLYSRNLKRLAELAGARVECEMPRLENTEESLRLAGLSVRFSFDGKDLADLNDGEFSGGQRVIASLILLVGLLSDATESSGFVFVDEPFAHLDVQNVDRVGRFLVGTGTQFILTSPNTNNLAAFRPAGLVISTRKRVEGERHAPVPTHVRRLREVHLGAAGS